MNSTELKNPGLPRRAYVIDDDRSIRTSLVTLLTTLGLQPRPFASGQDFLDELEMLAPGFLMIDHRMPTMSGIDLLSALRERDCFWPAAIMTGHGEIPVAVQAIRLGAIDFLEKPFGLSALREVIEAAFEQLPAVIAKSARYKSARRAVSSLSPRQREVFKGVVAGFTSKEIALRQGLSHRTVESYRKDMMAKLGVDTLVELMELKLLLGE